ncbi:hypothetical protein [Candidatus Tisiphia endosymbiont of Dascillus cervinus]|uniref:hypothetical protein n=1 Tax=Candidatus Tisiphia endosymbiont of Dascillus cervinus TaxID=3066253 RepID=UPI00312CAC52|nr:hypothetical protein [Rickettsiaceae bacterium]MDD9337003.1 hypothetical protein [Rickettsiaceae bacterium]
MKKLWLKQDKQDILKICNKWINGCLTAKEIKENIGIFAWAVNSTLPRLEWGYLSSQVRILVDDILEMDSITDEEKDQAILELLDNGYEEELQSLAKRVIAQIEIDTKEYKEQYLKEAEERGYCRKLTEAVIESLK